jgi:hypothetical protein
VHPAAYARLFPNAGPSDATLIDAKARTLASTRFDETSKIADVVLERLIDLVHGPNLARLRAREIDARKRASPALVEAMRRLNDDDVRLLEANASALAPWLVSARLEATDADRRERLAGILIAYVLGDDGWSEGHRLPYGVAVKRDTGCVPNHDEPDDTGRTSMVMCGNV